MATVTLIRPPSVVGRYALTLNATPPLTQAYLAAALAADGHRVTVIDAVGEALEVTRPGYRPDVLVNGLAVSEVVARVPADTTLLGISCLFSHEWPVVRALVAALAERFAAVPIVCGGEHPTAVPEFSLGDAPGLAACALGEGEQTIVDLARAVDRGDRTFTRVAGLVVRGERGEGFVRTAPRARIGELDAIAEPRWDLVPIERYLAGGHSFGVDRGRTIPLLATRGCPFRCTFCSSPAMWTTRYVARTPARVVDEIERAVRELGAEAVDFYDLTAVIKREWILAFCREMVARRVPVTWQLPSGTRSEALDAEVLDWMYRAGCRNVSYAPESGAVSTLARIKKRVNLDAMERSMRAAVARGINVKANILVGFPDETPDELRATLRWIVRMARAGVHDVSVWTFVPYPGTALFDSLRASGAIGELSDDYFAGLLSYSDLAGAVSYARHFSPASLERYRVGGMALFYAASWATHPARPLRTARNLLRSRYESRLEMSLGNLARRMKSARRARVSPAFHPSDP